ncbi:FMN-binding protein [Amnibacterium kyonggiense]
MTRTDTGAHLRRLAAIGGGLLGVAALAGCAPTASTEGTPAPGGSAAAPSTTASAGAGGSTASGALKDGSYTATGDYESPGGPSAVGVTVTLKDGTISAVQVVPEAADPTARQYEQQFASGIGAAVIGKRIDGLQVGAVSGSSLTSRGFEAALAEIRSRAAA